MWVDVTIDYGAFKHLRYLSVYDVSPTNWKSLEQCPDLETIILEDGSDLQWVDFDVEGRLAFEGTITLSALKNLTINCEYTWTYPSEYALALLNATSMPSLQSITLDISFWPDALQILADLFPRIPTVQDITIRHFACSTSKLIDQLARLKDLRKLLLAPYGTSEFKDEDMEKLVTSLPGLEELALRCDGQGGDQRCQLTPHALPPLAGCASLKKLDIDLRLSDIGLVQAIPCPPMTTIRQLHITPVELGSSGVGRFAAFLVKTFPELEVLSVAPDKFNSQWRPKYEERKELSDAFARLRASRAGQDAG